MLYIDSASCSSHVVRLDDRVSLDSVEIVARCRVTLPAHFRLSVGMRLEILGPTCLDTTFWRLLTLLRYEGLFLKD